MENPSVSEAISAVKTRVRHASQRGSRWMAGYAKMKVSSDWVYPRICELLEPDASVLDLGAGMGLLGLILHELQRGHAVHGIEWDERKVDFGRRLLPSQSTCSLHQGDILTDPWPTADVIVLVDVLHYFPIPVQKELLQRIAGHLAPGGMLFLRDMNGDAGGRARLTRMIEEAAVAVRWNRASKVHWRGIQAIQDDLALGGLQPALCLADKNLFDGNCLIAARKPRTSG